MVFRCSHLHCNLCNYSVDNIDGVQEELHAKSPSDVNILSDYNAVVIVIVMEMSAINQTSPFEQYNCRFVVRR